MPPLSPGSKLSLSAKGLVTTAMSRSPSTTNRRTILLLAVATLMCTAAALAIGILLFGDFGGIEARILGSTLLIAGYGTLAIPGAILWDQRRLLPLAAALAGLAILAASLNLVGIWWERSSNEQVLGKMIATVAFFLIATVVTAALAARPRHRLFSASVALSFIAAAMATAAMWAEVEREGYLRLLGAVVVLDVLLVALQPLLMRARRSQTPRPLRIADTSGRTTEVTVQADSLASAAAKAIRVAERQGRHVHSVEVLERVDAESRTPVV